MQTDCAISLVFAMADQFAAMLEENEDDATRAAEARATIEAGRKALRDLRESAKPLQVVQRRGVVDFIRSTFGGGWMVAHFDEDGDACSEIMGEEATPQPAIGGTFGWLIEPQDLDGIVQALGERGIEVAS